jgi:RHS repeat-associated protein
MRRLGWDLGRAAAGLAVVVGALAALPAQPVAASGGNASINLTKSVTGTTVTPHLSLSSLQVSAPTAVPGDTLTYTTTLVNDATVLGLTGSFTAANGQDAAATVAGWWDDVEYKPAGSNTWVVLGGFAAPASGYTFTVAPPSRVGLTVTTVGAPAGGVTYPQSGDGIVGSTMAPGATGTWSYSAKLQLTPAQVATLSSSSTEGGIRNVVHFEVTPRTSGGQPFTYRTEFTDPLLTTSAAATNAKVTFTPNYTSPGTVTSATVAGLASIAPGASVQVAAAFTVPAVAPKGASETDSAYLARLQGAEGSALTTSVSASATGSTGPVTAAAPQPATSTEVLPIVTIAKSGPATAQAGSPQTYQLSLDNAGGAAAQSLALADSTPDGNSGTISGAPATLAAAATGSATSTYQIPATEPPGPLTDTATVTWADRNGNTYGPLSASFTTTVKTAFFGSKLSLAPANAGPDPVGGSQSLTATFTDASGNPIVGQTITLSVTGANPTTATVTTGPAGTATFSYSGTVAGADVAQASFTQGSLLVQSNTSNITWISPVATVGTTPAQGNFYSVAGSPSTFVATPGETPVFGQTFPTIDFNPPAGTVNHNVSGVGPTTRPFTDVTTDAMSNFDGTIVAQGNGMQAGVGPLQSFDAVFTANFVVSKPGDVTFDVLSDDGFLLGVGGGASRVSGAYENAPSSNASPFQGYPLVGAFNESSGGTPVTNPVTIHFPAAGSYPYELDYFECCTGDLSLTMTVATFTAQTSPLSVYVGYADGLRPAGSIFPFPWLGSPNVTFEGCHPGCTFDGGAIRLDNSGATPITVNSLTVDFGSCHFAIWPGNLTLPPGQIMIFAQEANGASSGCDNQSGQFDTSDIPYAGFCGQSGIIPQVNVTTGGVEQTFADTQQILNTGGEDTASCPGHNESLSWQRIGGGGTAIDVPMPPAVTLQMTPPSLSGAVVGHDEQFQVTALDGSGNSVPNLPVQLSVFGVNTQQLAATTNAAGVATFSYAGTTAGSDTLSATAFISGLRAVSNQVPVTWVVPTPTSTPPPTSSGTGPPAITEATPAPGAVITGKTPITADLTPPDGGAIASWSVTLQSSAGTPITLASGTGTPPTPLATLDPTVYPAGTYTLGISGTSTAGGTSTISEQVVLGSSSSTVTGGGTAGQSPPTISPPSPADGTVVTAPLPVTATFTPPTGQTIASWQVTYQGAHDSTATTLASGTGTPPATLATFDPTLLPDDTYTITVTATASGGGVQSVTSTVAVSGGLKLGREVQTFDDLNVPVDGFQMDLRRVYDSSDKTVGDFGVGWHVDLANFKLATNGALGLGGWSEYPTSCFFGLCNYGLTSSAPHDVTITFPSGHQDVFDFTPSGGDVLFYWEGSAAFTARPGTGTTDTLAVEGDPSLIYGFDGNLYDSDFNPYEPTRFVLTTRQGQTYVLDLSTGLVSETDSNGNTLSVDALGVHSSSGQSLTFTRDAAGRITDVHGPTGQHLQYAYSAAGDLASYTDADGNTTTYSYDGNHDLLSETGPGQSKPLQQLVYDSSGRLSEVVDANGNVTTVADDTTSDQQIITDPNGKLTTIDTFDTRGDLVEQDQVFGGRTLKTTWTYDSLGRQLSETDPLGHTTSSSYDSSGNLVSSTDADGVTLHYGYDAHGNLTSVMGPDGSTLLTMTRNAAGNVIESERPDGTAFRYTYDSAGHVTSITDPSGRTEQLNWSPAGELTSVVDPSGNTTLLSFNSSGQELSQTDPGTAPTGGQTTSYTYDPNGNLTSMTDGNGNTTSYTYDAFGHELSVTDPLGHVTTYSYDGAGNEISSTDAMNQTITYGYDTDGKLDQLKLPDGSTLSVTYDALERPIVMSNPTATVDVTYDDAGRVVGTTESGPQIPTVSLGYTYDPRGDRLSMTGPEGTTQYAYDNLQRLTSVTDPSGGVFGMTYNGHSTLATLSRPNGVDDTLTYSGNELLSRVSTLASSTVASNQYTYDPNGLVASMTNSAGTTTYQYDAIGELTSATPPSGVTATYSYDAAGNRTSGAATYGTGDLLSGDAAATYAYDADGELTSRTPTGGGAASSYHWNALHQLTSISLPDGTTEAFGYDPLGRRVLTTHGSSSTAYVYDGSNLHLEYANGAPASAPTAVYTDGLAANQVLEMARGGQQYYYLVDDEGSTTALTDQSGNVVQTYSYDPFGNMAAGSGGSVPNTVTYTGQQWDATSGLYYYGSRWYDPTIGRFLSEDPVANPNPYPYVHNDPTNATDPTGAQELEEEAVTLEVDATLTEEALSPEAQLVQQLAQDAADQGPAYLSQFLTEGELQALQDMPYLARAFYGTAIQRAVAAALEDLGVEFVFNAVGPDFAFGDVLVELTTEGAVAAHIARGGLYLIAEIVTYVLEL